MYLMLEQNVDVLQTRSLVEAASTLQLFVMPLENLAVLVNYQNLQHALIDCKHGTNLRRKGANYTGACVEC